MLWVIICAKILQRPLAESLSLQKKIAAARIGPIFNFIAFEELYNESFVSCGSIVVAGFL